MELPRAVRREEVALAFSTVVERNATLFRAFVGNEGQLEVWQPVDPVRRAAMTVYLPSVPDTDRLIANLSVQSFISPNGDGIGDAAEIRFHVLKTDAPAQVRIYTLDGRLVRILEGQHQPDQSYLYIWAGRDQDERIVPPGSYLCRVEVEAKLGPLVSIALSAWLTRLYYSISSRMASYAIQPGPAPLSPFSSPCT